MWKKYRHIYLTFGFAFAFSMFLLFLGEQGYLNDRDETKPEINLVNLINTQEIEIGYSTDIYEEIIYSCGDTKTRLLKPMDDYVGLTFYQMRNKWYPKSQGWEYQIISPEQIVFYMEKDVFCSEHKNYRHLAQLDGMVVMMYGPSGSDIGVAHYTGIPLTYMPKKMKKQIQDGKLEFSNEEEAFQALDSLEEFMN
ncbi:hypothetical protein GGQ84_001430 [Desulfitispora alkaliphila]|uniref:hypothetical protein n=1 Tax=Desulfitispora alkaliphila TaxID=622674 RepID=UPI003D1FEF5E